MIKAIKDFFEKRRVRKILGKYVSVSVVDDILSGKFDSRAGKLDEKTLGIVLVLVEYSNPQEVAKNIGVIADLAKEYQVAYEAMTNGLMVFTFGRFPTEQNPEANRQTFVKAILTKLAKSVKIVHGTGTGHVGILGGGHIFSYSFLMPRFGDALRILCSLKDGESREMTFS